MFFLVLSQNDGQEASGARGEGTSGGALNGAGGTRLVILSTTKNGRQHILIESLSKSVALRPSDLKNKGRSVHSLSTIEIITVLKSRNVSDLELYSADKADLRSKICNLTSSPEEIVEQLACANASKNTAEKNTRVRNAAVIDLSQAADHLSNMFPELLHQQARMMRSMNLDAV